MIQRGRNTKGAGKTELETKMRLYVFFIRAKWFGGRVLVLRRRHCSVEKIKYIFFMKNVIDYFSL